MILGPPLLGSLERRRSSGAEQLSCKQQVVGSNPTAGSGNAGQGPVRTRSDFEARSPRRLFPGRPRSTPSPPEPMYEGGHAADGRDPGRA
jgi:hypothetical protein